MTRWPPFGLVGLLILLAGCHRPADDTTFPDTLGQSTAAGPTDPSKPLAIAQDVPPPGPGMPISRPGTGPTSPPPALAPGPALEGGSGTPLSTSGVPEQ